MSYWHCMVCDYGRNDREDGPVCDKCGTDATQVEQRGCVSDNPHARAAGIRMEPVTPLPVTREDFLPNGTGTEVPF